MEKLSKCTLCGGSLKRETRTVQRKYRDVVYSYEQLGDYCVDCNEGFFSPEDLALTKGIRQSKKRVIDSLTD